MTKTLVYIGIAVLAVIAVVLGYQIYRQTTDTGTVPPVKQAQDTSVPQTVGNQQTSQQTTQSSSGTADEQAVLNFPGPNATQIEKQQYTDALNRFAKETGVLEISNGCKPSPIVIRIQKDQEIQIKNTGITDIKVIISPQIQFPISANSIKTVKASFGGVGTFGYRCEGFENISGVIDIP